MPQLSFKLKDRYTMMIWNPTVLGVDDVRAINAEYFFSVLFSVHREKTSSNEKVSEHAKKIMSKFIADISSFEEELIGLIKMAELKKQESVFSITFSQEKGETITFSPTENSGVCPENAAFLRSFVKFDEYVALLNEIHAMALIPEKEFYRQRKIAQGKFSGIMEGYNKLIKRFHGERKKSKSSLESVA